MPIHILKLRDKREIARNTFLFEFEKPANFTCKPGQYAGFTLINPKETDTGGITRRFSLLNTDNDEHIAFATRIQSSAYKRTLMNFVVGDEIKFAGPTGTFTLHDDKNVPAVLIAGGIGIAPFYSMLKEAAYQHCTRAFQLFYGNQTPDDAAFLNELMDLEKNNAHFQLIPVMADANEAWRGERGFISKNMINQYIPDLSQPIYYVCGSPAMVTAIQEMLAEMGIDEDKVKVEDFPGY